MINVWPFPVDSDKKHLHDLHLKSCSAGVIIAMFSLLQNLRGAASDERRICEAVRLKKTRCKKERRGLQELCGVGH